MDPILDCVPNVSEGRDRRVGRILGARFELPVFFYAEAALSPERRRLSLIRRGEYEGLSQKLSDPAWRPDAAPESLGLPDFTPAKLLDTYLPPDEEEN